MSARRTSVLLHVAEIRTRADGSVVLVLEGGDRITVKRGESVVAGVGSWCAYAARPAEADATDHVLSAAELADRRRVARKGQGCGLRDQASIAF